MLDVGYYREQERLAKSLCPSHIMLETHNLDVFEKVGFLVRVDNFQQTHMISDSMQERRFESYMEELGGLNVEEFREFCEALLAHIDFQEHAYPAHRPYISFDTMFSSFVVYKKIARLKPDFSTILEIGPGSGGLAFFLARHAGLKQYTQVEACESFYLLQSEIGRFLFGAEFSEEVFSHDASHFFSTAAETKKEYRQRLKIPKAHHYPYWKIGKIYDTHAEKYDVVTSNANLAEFNPRALADYLVLIKHVLKRDGILFVHCFGSDLIHSAQGVYDALYKNGFAPIFFYDPAGSLVVEKYGDSIKDFIENIDGEVVVFPAGNTGEGVRELMKHSHKRVWLCDDIRAGEVLEGKKILSFDELIEMKNIGKTTMILASYNPEIIESTRKRATEYGVAMYEFKDMLACLSLHAGQGVFVKHGNPLFEKYYLKERFGRRFDILDEGAYRAIFMRLDRDRKGRKLYSRDEIMESLFAKDGIDSFEVKEF